MTEPTVEEVREALAMGPIGKDPSGRVAVIEAAARLWVDAAEPDIEAAIARYQQMIESDMEGADWNYDEFTAGIVAAAFGDNTLIRRADR